MKQFVYLFALVALIQSCGAPKNANYAYDQSYSGGDGTKNREMSGEQSVQTERKMIYTGYLNLLAKNKDTTIKNIERLAVASKGYVVETGSERVVIRIPNNSYQSVLTQIRPLGKVTYENTNAQDVTEEYTDNALRLDNAEKSRTRYLEILKDAKTVEEILLVEKELERLNIMIETIKGRQGRLNELTQYATITIQVKQKKKLGPLGFIFKGVYKGIKWLFVRG
jgi:hypothetical protein